MARPSRSSSKISLCSSAWSNIAALFAAASSACAAPHWPEQTPIQVATAFYNSIAGGDCEQAIRLREGYSLERCRSITGLRPALRSNSNQDRDVALVSADITYRLNGQPRHDVGCLRLEHRQQRWLITAWISAPCDHGTRFNAAAIGGPHAGSLPAGSLQQADADSFEGDIAMDSGLDQTTAASAPAESLLVTIKDLARTGHAMPPAPSDPSFAHPALDLSPPNPVVGPVGSAAVLHACWTPQQLAGTPAERTIQNGLTPDPSGPGRADITAALQYRKPLSSSLQRSIRYVDPSPAEGKPIALTFDLCEQADERTGYDAAIVDYLRSERIPATFFAGGKWMRSHPQRTMQLMADPLFEIGNHAWTHGNMRVLTGQHMRDQITWTQAQYIALHERLANLPCARDIPSAMAAIPPVPRVFRFPYGTCNAASLQATAESGLAAIQWDVVTADPWRKQSAKGIANAVLNGVRENGGSIVIMHANGRGWKTAQALPMFIPELKRRGYRLVTVSDLLRIGNPFAVEQCYEKRRGDNAHYDRLFGEGTGLVRQH